MPAKSSSLAALIHAGIDVSADTLSVCLLLPGSAPEQFTCSNDPPGHRRLLSRLRERARAFVAVLEATGCFSFDLALCLHAAKDGVVAVVNPRQARDFAKGLGRRGKTDAVDARVLSEYAERMPLIPWQPPLPAALELRSIMRRLSELTLRRSAEKNHLYSAQRSRAGGSCVPQSIKRQLCCLTHEIERLKAAAQKLVEGERTLARQYELLLSVKGIASLSALRLLGELSVLPPELGCRQWVALAGLDPRPWESGASVNRPRRLSRQGNRHLRNALYMPALVSVRYEPALKAFYQHLLERGKPKMLALTAAMRKLLHALWGMLHHDQPFTPAQLSPTSA